MAKKLYVGNMPYETTEQDLQQMFGQYGTVVTVTIIKDRYSGRSKGFGFVEMEDDAAADEAIRQLNGKEMGPDDRKRALVVNEARPMQPRKEGFQRGPRPPQE
jgi:RNA recognition motif-containing protein